LPCCAVALRNLFQNCMDGARHGHGMACVNQTRSHCENQMRKTKSKLLAARHGRGMAWARHAMCELALRGVIKRSFHKHPELSVAGQAPSQPEYELMKDCFHVFPSLVSMLVGRQWQ
jgi:hypothetical protein